jgi:hypothetical protein
MPDALTKPQRFERKEFRKLQDAGFDVVEFSQYHYRVNEQLDIYPNDRSMFWAWRDVQHNVASSKSGFGEMRAFHSDRLTASAQAHFSKYPARPKPQPAPPMQRQILEQSPEPDTFEERLKTIYQEGLMDWPDVWALVRAELEKARGK